MNMKYKEKCLVHFQLKVHATHKILHMTTFVKPINVKITMKMKILELNWIMFNHSLLLQITLEHLVLW